MLVNQSINRPFPSSKKSHLQGEAKCEAIDMKMIFNYDANKTHFHNKGFALSLVLKVRVFGTQKWPIDPSISRPSLVLVTQSVSQLTLASVGQYCVSQPVNQLTLESVGHYLC